MKKNKLIFISAVLAVALLFTSCGSILSAVTKMVVTEDETVGVTPQESANSKPNKKPSAPTVSEKPETEEVDKYAEYMVRASEIEKYAANNLETAVTQMDLNAEAYNVYMMWDELLNEVYQYLKQTLPASEFDSLRVDEIEWVEQKEAAMNQASAEWEDGSGEPLARYSEGIRFTRERCYYLIGMLE